MNRLFVIRNINLFSIAIFLILFAFINFLKPNFLYNDDGSLREFGLGYKRKTIMPGWFVAIILAILSYTSVKYYIIYPKLTR
tara:strand:+ start:112 stop:357 length:246 start_codon:yes stop_codon:yes gene_type:complete